MSLVNSTAVTSKTVQTGRFSTLKHRPLATNNAIRLLRVVRSTNIGAPIVCSLVHTCLSTAPVYRGICFRSGGTRVLVLTDLSIIVRLGPIRADSCDRGQWILVPRQAKPLRFPESGSTRPKFRHKRYFPSLDRPDLYRPTEPARTRAPGWHDVGNLHISFRSHHVDGSEQRQYRLLHQPNVTNGKARRRKQTRTYSKYPRRSSIQSRHIRHHHKTILGKGVDGARMDARPPLHAILR